MNSNAAEVEILATRVGSIDARFSWNSPTAVNWVFPPTALTGYTARQTSNCKK